MNNGYEGVRAALVAATGLGGPAATQSNSTTMTFDPAAASLAATIEKR